MAVSFLLPLLLLARPDGGASLKSDIENYFRKDGWAVFVWDKHQSEHAFVDQGPVRGLHLHAAYRDYGAQRPEEADPSNTRIQLASKEVEKATGKDWRITLEDYSYSQRSGSKPFKVLVRVFYYKGHEGGFVDLTSSPYVRNEKPSFSEAAHKDAMKTLEGLFGNLKKKFQSK